MKKAIILLFVAVFAIQFANSQEKFQGVIKSKVTYEGRELSPQEKQQLPTQMNQFYRDEMIRSEQVTPMTTIVTIVNIETEESSTLIDLMGQKYAITMTKEDLDKAKEGMDEEEDKYEVEIVDETKEIAGYTCKKAIIKSEDNEITVYYTDEIDLPKSEQTDRKMFEKLDGVPMEYSMVMPQLEDILMTVTVSEISDDKVKKSQFKVPSDFQKITPEEAKQIFGGNVGG